MRSKGRTERRALLAVDGVEDMQGGYVQLTRSKHRTDLYLTVGPEPLGADDEHPHRPGRRGRRRAAGPGADQDGSKTLASDTPDLLDVRRLSTGSCAPNATGWPSCGPPVRRIARGSCGWPPAGRRGRAGPPASRPSRGGRRPSRRPSGSAARRRDLQSAGAAGAGRARAQDDDWAGRPGGRAAGSAAPGAAAAPGLDGSHDADLRVRSGRWREDAWRRRVDQRALALDPPGWLLAELGPVPSDPRERAVWRLAAAELDGYRRAYGLDHPGPAKHVGAGWPGTGGRRSRPRRHRCAGRPGAGRRSAAAAATPPAGHRERSATHSRGTPLG